MKKLIAFLLMTNTACQNDNKLDSKTTFVYHQDTVNAPIFSENKRVIKKDTIAETVIDSVMDKIYHLRKIQALNKQCKISMLTQEPTESDAHYTFKVGFNRPDRFETRFIFSFNQKQNVVFYYDTINDELIDVNKWDIQ
jgi:hypothetical protein